MSAPLSRLLICLGFIAIIASCKPTPAVSDNPKANQQLLDDLIDKGKKLQSTHKDSLQLISRQLDTIAGNSGDKTALVYSELFTAHYYWLSAKPAESMEIAIKSLKDAEKWDIKAVYPDVYSLISNLHKENGNYPMAFDADEKGLKWAITNKDTTSIIALLSLKAMLTHTHQLFLHSKVMNDTSINLQFAALRVAESSPKYEAMRIRFYDNISQYYLDNKNYEQSIFYGDKGVALAMKYNQPRSLTYSYSWLGGAWFAKGNRPKGLDYLNKALTIARQLKEPYRVMEIQGHLFDCYYAAGDYKEAIALQTRYRDMHDSLQVSTNESKISEQQIKYETVKKDQTIASMGHEGDVKNRLIIAVLAGSMIFIAFSVILFLQYRLISRNNRIISISNEKKDKALKNIAHIQAHELRKPLASIMGLVNLIKAMDHEVDKECLTKLDEASKELDEKIHNVLSQVDKEAH